MAENEKKDDRVTIPLYMLRGNMEAMLENEIPLSSISLRRYNRAGVVLVVHMTEEQKAEARKLGFRTEHITDRASNNDD